MKALVGAFNRENALVGGLLRDCDIFCNLRITFVPSSSTDSVTLQEEALYYWATADTAARATARKTSWKMSNGACAAEEAREKAGARYTEAEWQQMVLGLRREHKEKLETLRKEQDEALFKVGDTVQIFSFLSYLYLLFLFPSHHPFRLYRDLLF